MIITATLILSIFVVRRLLKLQRESGRIALREISIPCYVAGIAALLMLTTLVSIHFDHTMLAELLGAPFAMIPLASVWLICHFIRDNKPVRIILVSILSILALFIGWVAYREVMVIVQVSPKKAEFRELIGKAEGIIRDGKSAELAKNMKANSSVKTAESLETVVFKFKNALSGNGGQGK